MSLASASQPAPQATAGQRGIPPLPLLTVLNFFNYMDRQVVYGMSDKISETFHLNHSRFGWLAFVNLMVFALASAISGPIADRMGPRRVIFTGVAVWSVATIGSAFCDSFWSLLVCRAIVGVGEGAYGPSANALLIAAAPPDKRGRALGIYNIGMAFGATTGLVVGNALASIMHWHYVFLVAGGPAVLLAISAAFVAAPPRLIRPVKLPARAYVLAPTYLIALAGGILSTFGASGLVVWSRELIIDERHLSIRAGTIFMAGVGVVCAMGGVVAGGYLGDALTRRIGRGGHALAIGVSLLVAVPFGVASLLMTNKPGFMVLTAVSVFLLSVYNGPAAAVIDELGPAKFAATLQAFAMFWIHVLGNAPAGPTVGWLADRSHAAGTTAAPIALALQSTVAAFGVAGVLFVIVARRQRREPAFH
jgi:MFS family permease